MSSNATSSAEDLSFGGSGRNSPVHSSARVTRRGRKTDGGGKSGKEGRGENGCGYGPQARPLIASASRSHLLACGFRICCVQTRSVAAELCARLTPNRFRAASPPRWFENNCFPAYDSFRPASFPRLTRSRPLSFALIHAKLWEFWGSNNLEQTRRDKWSRWVGGEWKSCEFRLGFKERSRWKLGCFWSSLFYGNFSCFESKHHRCSCMCGYGSLYRVGCFYVSDVFIFIFSFILYTDFAFIFYFVFHVYYYFIICA